MIPWNDYFVYDETSETGLRWRLSKSRSVKPGQSVGNLKYDKKLDKRVGCNVKFNRKNYKIHRIIWEIFNGPIPEGMVIDHLNGDPWDNRVNNLACKSKKHNRQNIKKMKNNSSGFTGISWTRLKKCGKIRTYCRAQVTVSGRIESKYFSAQKFGLMQALKCAIIWRKSQIHTINKSDGKYTDRHGT